MSGKLEEHRHKWVELETVDWDSALRIFDVCVSHELTFIMRTPDPTHVWKECIINEWEALEGERRQDYYYLRKAGMTTQDLTAQGRMAFHLPKRLGGAGMAPLVTTVPVTADTAHEESIATLSKRSLIDPTEYNNIMTRYTLAEDGTISPQKDRMTMIHY